MLLLNTRSKAAFSDENDLVGRTSTKQLAEREHGRVRVTEATELYGESEPVRKPHSFRIKVQITFFFCVRWNDEWRRGMNHEMEGYGGQDVLQQCPKSTFQSWCLLQIRPVPNSVESSKQDWRTRWCPGFVAVTVKLNMLLSMSKYSSF